MADRNFELRYYWIQVIDSGVAHMAAAGGKVTRQFLDRFLKSA